MAGKRDIGLDGNSECFVIMPISDPEGYEKGHFKHVYDDILAPAAKKNGYKPVRADDILQTSMIHIDILKKLIESPMAICDLSSRNPNVLFELGLRQAFDKPVVLVQEIGTEKIFDIAPLKYTEYRRSLRYHEVLADQEAISLAINATQDSSKRGDGINSIVKLLSLTNSATLKEVSADKNDLLLQYVRAEMNELRNEFRTLMQDFTVDNEFIRRNNKYILKDNELGHRLVKAKEMIYLANDIALNSKDPSAFSEAFGLLNQSQEILTSYINNSNTKSDKELAYQILNEASNLEKRLLSKYEKLNNVFKK